MRRCVRGERAGGRVVVCVNEWVGEGEDGAVVREEMKRAERAVVREEMKRAERAVEAAGGWAAGARLGAFGRSTHTRSGETRNIWPYRCCAYAY